MSFIESRGLRGPVAAAALLCLSTLATPAARAAEGDAAAPGQPLTLEQAIEHALEKNENIVIERAAARFRGGRRFRRPRRLRSAAHGRAPAGGR